MVDPLAFEPDVPKPLENNQEEMKEASISVGAYSKDALLATLQESSTLIFRSARKKLTNLLLHFFQLIVIPTVSHTGTWRKVTHRMIAIFLLPETGSRRRDSASTSFPESRRTNIRSRRRRERSVTLIVWIMALLIVQLLLLKLKLTGRMLMDVVLSFFGDREGRDRGESQVKVDMSLREMRSTLRNSPFDSSVQDYRIFEHSLRSIHVADAADNVEDWR